MDSRTKLRKLFPLDLSRKTSMPAGDAVPLRYPSGLRPDPCGARRIDVWRDG